MTNDQRSKAMTIHTLKVRVEYPEELDDLPFLPTLGPQALARRVRHYIEHGLLKDQVLWQVDELSVTAEEE